MTCSCSGAVTQGGLLLGLVQARCGPGALPPLFKSSLAAKMLPLLPLLGVRRPGVIPTALLLRSARALLQEAAAAAGRRVTLLRRGGAGGDHPLDPACPESEYLTNLLFRVL
jgi:hypothetical protein